MLQEIVLSLIGIVLTVFVIPWLRALAEKAKASASIQGNSTLLYQLKSMIFDLAANTAEKEYPRIAERLKSDVEFTKDDVKKELQALGTSVYDKVVQIFREQGIQITDHVGPTLITELIRRAADQVSPFPGKETAAALLEPEMPTKLIKLGIKGDFTETEEETDEADESDEGATNAASSDDDD